MSTTPLTPTAGNYRWYHELKQLFVLSLERVRAGERDPARFYSDIETEYLRSIGMNAQELFDFADDHVRYDGDPDWETVLLITAARRDYFLNVQNGQISDKLISVADLPAKDVKLEGIPWLSRAIKKAEAKLRGEMPAELMFNCSGDRSFFRQHHLHPADFLRHVWASHGDEKKVLEYLKAAQPPVEDR